MLDQWLSAQLKDPQLGPFDMWEVTESKVAESPSADILAADLMHHLVGEEFLAKAAEMLPEGTARTLVQSRLPEPSILRRGFFGELLAIRALETFHGHTVPIKKLRYRTTNRDSPKATDVLAIKVDSNHQITEVAYVEAKLRTTRSGITRLAIEAHDQLKRDCIPESPAILGFAVAVLVERRDPLADVILRYLRDRTTQEIDSHHIFLVMDDGCWRDSDLTPLIEHESLLDPLAVHVVRISDLPQKVQHVYELIGVEAMSDDD